MEYLGIFFWHVKKQKTKTLEIEDHQTLETCRIEHEQHWKSRSKLGTIGDSPVFGENLDPCFSLSAEPSSGAV